MQYLKANKRLKNDITSDKHDTIINTILRVDAEDEEEVVEEIVLAAIVPI